MNLRKLSKCTQETLKKQIVWFIAWTFEPSTPGIGMQRNIFDWTISEASQTLYYSQNESVPGRVQN